jgi:hypothetical protein
MQQSEAHMDMNVSSLATTKPVHLLGPEHDADLVPILRQKWRCRGQRLPCRSYTQALGYLPKDLAKLHEGDELLIRFLAIRLGLHFISVEDFAHANKCDAVLICTPDYRQYLQFVNQLSAAMINGWYIYQLMAEQDGSELSRQNVWEATLKIVLGRMFEEEE